jgi:TetR/AcrR family transcriptional regulator
VTEPVHPPGSVLEDRRRDILDAAEREFSRRGYAGARIEAIARCVGVRKAALYYYYPGKAALYQSVVQRVVELFTRRVGAALDAPGRFEDRLDRTLAELDRLLASRPTAARLALRHMLDAGSDEDGPPQIEPAITTLVERFLLFYEAGVRAGAFRPLPVGHLVPSLLGATLFYYAADDFRAALLCGAGGADRPGEGERHRETRRFVGHGVITDGTRSDGRLRPVS